MLEQNLTREALRQFSKEQLIDLILELVGEMKQLKARVVELEQKLKKPAKDSANSSMPSSTDMAPKKRSLRKKTGKSPGGQKGHTGTAREFDAHPDHIEEHLPTSCEACNAPFTSKEKERIAERRQQVEIPPIEPIVTEHHSIALSCMHCGEETRGSFPHDIPAAFCFGPRLQSLIVSLKEEHHFSYVRLMRHLKDFLSVQISTGALVSIVQRIALKAEPLYKKIKEAVKNGSVIESDETGSRIAGRRAFCWVFRNELHTYLQMTFSRGSKVIEGFVGNLFTSAAWVSDRFSAQLSMMTHGGRQFCLAHLLRDFQYCLDAYHTQWSHALMSLLEKAMSLRRRLDEMVEGGQDVWSDPKWIAWRFRAIATLEQRLDYLLEEKRSHKEEKALCKNLLKSPAAVLLFLHRADVPPTNNGSERDLRPLKIHQKVIGCFRSERGAQSHAIILSLLQTGRKQGRGTLEVLHEILAQPALA